MTMAYHIPPGWDTWARRFERHAVKYTDQQVQEMRALVSEMAEELKRQLATVARAGGKLSGETAINLMGQLSEFESVFGKRAQELVQKQVVDAMREGLDQVKEQVGDLGVTIPLEEIERMIFQGPESKLLLDSYLNSSIRYAGMVGDELRRTLALHLGLGSGLAETIRDLTKLTGWPNDAYWQGERLVRTEASYAYNLSNHKAMSTVAHDNPDLWEVWYEHAQGPIWGGPKNIPYPGPATPLDDRVGRDSLRMHGQARRPGQPFCDPLTKQCWPHPPNRPNDRATLVLARIDGNQLLLPGRAGGK